MKVIKNKHNTVSKKMAIIALILIPLALLAGFIYNFNGRENQSRQDPSSTSDTTNDSSTKGLSEPATLPENSQSLTTDDVPVNTSATAQITQLEQKGSVIHFSAKISDVDSLGRCVVVFSTPNDRPVTKEFDATKSGSNYVCSLNASELEFSYLGEWTVTLRYYSGEDQVTTSGTITIS